MWNCGVVGFWDCVFFQDMTPFLNSKRTLADTTSSSHSLFLRRAEGASVRPRPEGAQLAHAEKAAKRLRILSKGLR
jgi:hypothetical protein